MQSFAFSNDVIKEIVNFPSTIKKADAAFRSSSLEKIPEDIFAKNHSLENIDEMFNNTKLTAVDITLPSSVTTAKSFLSSIYELSGTVDFSKASVITNMDQCFYQSGKNLADTPITMVYSTSSSQAVKTYATTYSAYTNIYNSSENPDGKVLTVKTLPEDKFEKINDNAGPYTDITNQKYYVRYKGTDIAVDLEDFTNEDGNLYYYDGSQVLKITSTYKMFESSAVERVILPEYLKDKVSPNMFDSATKSDIKLIYRDPGNTTTDSSQDITVTNSNVSVYLYVTDTHLETNISSDNRYQGQVKNIYISEEVTSLERLLRKNKLVDRVCFDDKGTWKTMDFFGYMSSLKEIPKIPDTIESAIGAFARIWSGDYISFEEGFQLPPSLINGNGLFMSDYINSIPSNMFDKADSLQDMGSMFANCSRLEETGINIIIPQSVTMISECFSFVSHLHGVVDFSKASNLTIADNVMDVFEEVNPDSSFGTLTLKYSSSADQVLKDALTQAYDNAADGNIILEEVTAVKMLNSVTKNSSSNAVMKQDIARSKIVGSVRVKVKVVDPNEPDASKQNTNTQTEEETAIVKKEDEVKDEEK